MLIEVQPFGDMVAELIELSRLQGAERLPNMTDVDVDTIVSEAISRHKAAADNADIEVCIDAPSTCGCWATKPAGYRTGKPGFQCDCRPPRGSGRVSISRRRRGANIESPSPTGGRSRRKTRSGSSNGSPGDKALACHRVADLLAIVKHVG